MLGRYLKILDESLDKKLALLKEIEDLSLSQSVMIGDGAAFEDIDANMDDKAALIDRINKLDEGFQAMYDNIKENLEAQKEEYEDEIELIKKKISEVMSCSTQIQAIEARNKAAMEQRFAKAHKDIRSRTVHASQVQDYYKVANRLNAITPQFMDKKK
mgnify:CR=1 FL=1